MKKLLASVYHNGEHIRSHSHLHMEVFYLWNIKPPHNYNCAMECNYIVRGIIQNALISQHTYYSGSYESRYGK